MSSISTAKQSAMIEYSALSQPSHCPLGMYILPSSDNVLLWTGVLFIHRGYYASATLHFTLSIPSTYPSLPPIITFLPSTPSTPIILHPLISQLSGEFNLNSNSRFKDWTSGRDYIWMILHSLKDSFKKSGLDSVKEEDSFNREAWRLYRENTPLFASLAAQSSRLTITNSALYSVPSITSNELPRIQFRKLERDESELLRERLEEKIRGRLVPKGGK